MARFGWAMPGWAGLGNARQGFIYLFARRGPARHGRAWPGPDRRCTAMQGKVCLFILNGVAWRGVTGMGGVWRGRAGPCRDRLGLARQRKARFHLFILNGAAWRGEARRGDAGRGAARRRMARLNFLCVNVVPANGGYCGKASQV